MYIIKIIFIFFLISQININKVEPKSKFPYCEVCVNFLGLEKHEIVKIINGLGSSVSCNSICTQLSNSTMDSDCEFFCENSGVNEFIEITTTSNYDQYYMCELLKVCKDYENSKAKITGGNISPESGPAGTHFTFSLEYKINLFHKLGLSTMDLYVSSPHGNFDYFESQLIVYNGFGKYEIIFDFLTTNNSTEFPVDNYHAQFTLCENGCGTSHTIILDTLTIKFNITE